MWTGNYKGIKQTAYTEAKPFFKNVKNKSMQKS